MANKTFSLLTASCNNASYLGDWLGSVLAQSYRPLEVVFVDDASEDKTEKYVHETAVPQLELAGISLKYIRNPNRMYYGTSLKRAWQNASGSYFGTLDSDDALVQDAVGNIVRVYENNAEVGYIYTQFRFCDIDLKPLKVGFSSPPHKYGSMLDMGLARKHGHSHWRTFSARVPKLETIFKEGLRCAVDKYYAYRLEELAVGMFWNKVMYLYRWGDVRAISRTEKPRDVWREISAEAVARRKKYGLKAYPIVKG